MSIHTLAFGGNTYYCDTTDDVTSITDAKVGDELFVLGTPGKATFDGISWQRQSVTDISGIFKAYFDLERRFQMLAFYVQATVGAFPGLEKDFQEGSNKVTS